MPPRPKTPEEIEYEREKIADVAFQLISEKGYQSLTMRSIATRCKMSATKIYYYYSSKEAVYFKVLEKGFALLYNAISEAYQSGADEKDRFSRVCHAIFQFGKENMFYYEIMLCERTPRRMDFSSGSELEVAVHEKEVAIAFYELWEKTIFELSAATSKNKCGRYDTVRMFSLVHGIISLEISNNLREVDVDFKKLSEETVSYLLSKFDCLTPARTPI